jgi:hypothetical protein
MLPTKFRFICPSGFRGEDFLQINRSENLVGSIYGRTFMTTAHFVPIRSQTWPPQAIIISDWSISKNYSAVSEKKNLKSDQSETRISCGGHICEWIGTK